MGILNLAGRSARPASLSRQSFANGGFFEISATAGPSRFRRGEHRGHQF
jgi:hypothetical protein